MVATRRSSGKFIDVELSDNGKELQEVIPIEEQRAAIARASQESEEDEIQETSPVLVEPPSPTKKKETRGRKRKIPMQIQHLQTLRHHHHRRRHHHRLPRRLILLKNREKGSEKKESGCFSSNNHKKNVSTK